MKFHMNEEEKIAKKLKKSAMSYLARYEVSVQQFEKTMKRKLSNLKANLDDLDKIKIIRSLKNEMILAKFIDDKRFAETKIRSIRRQGGSERFIYAKLNEKGISIDIILELILFKSLMILTVSNLTSPFKPVPKIPSMINSGIFFLKISIFEIIGTLSSMQFL